MKKLEKKNNNLYFAIRFYFDPSAKISKTKGGNSLILELPSSQGWMLKSSSHKFESEKGLFFGNEEKIIQNECGFITGNFDAENNPLKNSPHTMQQLTSDQWDFPYDRKTAAFPLDYLYQNKFWPSVRRVDDAYGDRNLICTCEPIESYMEEEA